MARLEIIAVPVLEDNYVWLAHDPIDGETVVVDPGVAEPVLRAADARGWTLTQIWNTHWHGDHTGANQQIRAATGAIVLAPDLEADRIGGVDVRLREGDPVSIGAVGGKVMQTPGHTLGHIVFYLPSAEAVFVGDTLFAMGCGRLFEGTAADMWAVMQRLAALPGETQVYCAHEYTQTNARFAVEVEPHNVALLRRLDEVDALRARGKITLPSTIALERATNPFMRAASIEMLAKRRLARDGF